MKRVWLVLCIALCFVTSGCLSKAQPAMEPTIEPTASPLDMLIPSPTDSPKASASADATQAIKTPEEVVRYFFERWAAKDFLGTKSIMDERNQRNYPGDTQEGYEHILSLQVQKCSKVQSLSTGQLAHFEELGYKTVYEKAVVDVVFTIECDESGYGSYGPGKTTLPWKFSLVRESETSDWIIVSFGG